MTKHEQENAKNSSSEQRSQKNGKRKKEVNKTTKLAQSFLGLTLLIFAVYFAINFMSGTSLNPIKSGKKNSIQLDHQQVEIKFSEIQEKILDKVNQQPDLIEKVMSVDQITYKTEIKNQKIIDKLKLEIQNIFPHQTMSSGKFNMEIDIFNDEDSTLKNSEESTYMGEYSGTDTNIVLQISIFEKKSANKVGEIGISIPMKMLVVKEI